MDEGDKSRQEKQCFLTRIGPCSWDYGPVSPSLLWQMYKNWTHVNEETSWFHFLSKQLFDFCWKYCGLKANNSISTSPQRTKHTFFFWKGFEDSSSWQCLRSALCDVLSAHPRKLLVAFRLWWSSWDQGDWVETESKQERLHRYIFSYFHPEARDAFQKGELK